MDARALVPLAEISAVAGPSDEHERTIAFAEIAIGQIKALRQPAVPRVYEVWYNYATGYNPQLNQKVNETLSSSGTLTDSDIDQIYSAFISPTRIVDELAAPDMLLKYSLHEPRKGREDIKAFMTDFRKAFPDLNFWGTADLIAVGDYVVGQWDGGGTHTGPSFTDFLAGSLPANTGRKMRFTGTTVLKLKDGKIVEEIGLDDGVTALRQLGLIKLAA